VASYVCLLHVSLNNQKLDFCPERLGRKQSIHLHCEDAAALSPSRILDHVHTCSICHGPTLTNSACAPCDTSTDASNLAALVPLKGLLANQVLQTNFHYSPSTEAEQEVVKKGREEALNCRTHQI